MLATTDPRTASGRGRVGRASTISTPEEHPENALPSQAGAPGESRSSRPHRRKPWKTPDAEMRGQYRLTLEVSLVVVLGLVIVLFTASLQPSKQQLDIVLAEQEVVQMEEVQQTQQQDQLPPPPRPSPSLTTWCSTSSSWTSTPPWTWTIPSRP